MYATSRACMYGSNESTASITDSSPIGTFVIGLCARRTDLRRPILSALWASVADNSSQADSPGRRYR
jgi:hypothetical protein